MTSDVGHPAGRADLRHFDPLARTRVGRPLDGANQCVDHLRARRQPKTPRARARLHAPWQGKDPAGNDLAVLRQLNESYVRAFREADVAWYDAHLAPDFVVVNNDGSYHDRARALAEFAEPYFATYMRSFPVDKVRIRRFGDVWRKQADGRWLCIAAHITTHKPPA